MLFRTLFTATFFLLIVSCGQHEGPEGGPCDYKITKIPATIIAIQPHDSLYAEILFVVEKQSGPDTIYYTHEFPGFASQVDMKKYDLKMGNQFIYEEYEIVKGTCSPYFHKLKLEKYK